MTSAGLDALLVRERAAVEAALEEVAAEIEGPARVVEAMRYALEGSGKRLRPILCVGAYRAVSGDAPAAAYRLACSLELIHGYSLVHDDLPAMDDDAVRRGRASTHIAYGEGVAMVAGAALIPTAVRTASAAAEALGLAWDVRRDLVVELCRAAGAGGMVGGQLLDLEAEGRPVPLDDLERIHRMKTGALLAAAPLIGGIAAGAVGPARDALIVYGRSLGLAFQIADDILDITGSSSVLGKTAGRDTELEKATYPALAGVEEARVRAAGEVEAAVAALEAAGLDAPELHALAHYAVQRDR